MSVATKEALSLEEALALYLKTNTMVRKADKVLEKALGLTFFQASILHAIMDGANQPVKIAKRLGIQSQTVTGAVDRIEKLGLIIRVRDNKDDRRMVSLVLTQAAHEKYGVNAKKFREKLDKLLTVSANER